jgi:hypothetical protein
MASREEAILEHIDGSNLNARVDMAKNTTMLAREKR